MLSFPQLILPKTIGHRGARAYAPENTLAGIRVAADQGARWVEVDVKLSRDGVAILMHDDDVDRTTDGQGAVASMDFAELRKLDAGVRFGPDFAGERIPTLEETLALVFELDLGINLEIKPCPGREVETARVTLEVARAMWPADRPPPLISSFEVPSLETARDVAPDWPRGYLIDRRPDDWSAIADRIAATTININQSREDADTIADYLATGRPVLAYTVNDPVKAQALVALGVSSVFTDRPRDILPVLGD
ncbi:glycerophosphoryl diester phosphodiesterase [Skermanella stibiiresistens SB22]|uniref:Glycerophosphoryl diester phosphodiesterase n=1 Tax=Skermanella stibiiresistens SB22 TaxID=1385369 RepID=W9HCG1_9PROT|nr:glycerophosphodiester phosphodiesterase [Skermanella stibiiresistens]EWY42421.1 glycerophosphoryl diester phosphodiesterase [Skermanella stibiiresistens SB22]